MLKERIALEMREAMRKGEALKLSVFRLLAAAVHNREIAERSKSGGGAEVSLGDAETIQVIRAELKKRRDAIEAYDQGGRPEAAAGERAEAEVLSAFLPQELSDAEIAALVAEGRTALGAASPNEFGRLMGWVMARVSGRASGERVGEIVRRALTP